MAATRTAVVVGARRSVSVLVPLLYLAAAIGCYWRFVRDPSHHLSGGADGILFAWEFEWVRHSILSGHDPFVSTALNAPSGVSLTWNTWMPLLALVSLPLTLTVGPFVTVGVMLVLAPALSATAAYLVLRRMTGFAAGAAIGGALFGFSPYFRGHFGHLDLTFLPLLPLMLFVGYDLLVTQAMPRARAGGLLGLLVGMQMLISEEITALAFAAALPMVAWLVILNPRQLRQRWRHAAEGIGTGVGVAVLICGFPLLYQLFGPLALRHGTTSSTASADVASVVRPSLLQHFASAADVHANLHYGANGAENTAYLGWFLIIVCLGLSAWLIRDGDRFGLWWLLATGSTVLLSFGRSIHLNGHELIRGPWSAYKLIPFMSSAQPIRLSVVTILLVAWLIARSLARLQQRAAAAGFGSIGRVGKLVAPLAVAAVLGSLVPLFPTLPYASDPLPATPTFFTTSAVDAIPDGAITMVLPSPGFPRVDGMVWQIRAHLRFNLVGGYAVFTLNKASTYFPLTPVAWRDIQAVSRTGTPLNTEQVLAARASLRQYRIRDIVITHEMARFDQVSLAVEEIGQCHARELADVRLCQIGTAG